jgi:hypothetical protein
MAVVSRVRADSWHRSARRYCRQAGQSFSEERDVGEGALLGTMLPVAHLSRYS